jgi:hypothetical protein
MANLTVTGTVTDAAGLSTPFTGNITTLSGPVISSVVIAPQSAPSGTLRTITINATDPQNSAMTYTCLVAGVAATSTAQPNVFTFTA